MLNKKQIFKIKSIMNSGSDNFPLVFQALGDPGRFNIFKLLMNSTDICVTEVAHIFNITVSAASQQLRILERLRLILKIRMGQRVCYEVNYGNIVAQHLAKLIKKFDK